MSFFINSSEILMVSLLNNKNYCFNQEELSKCIGCSQPNISYVVNSLIEKGVVENIKGFMVVNQYHLIEMLTDYAKTIFSAEIYFSDKMLKIKNWSPKVYSFFVSYLRMFNIDYVITECGALNEICFVFSVNVIDISDIL